VQHLSSSIHTIHRPLARSHRSHVRPPTHPTTTKHHLDSDILEEAAQDDASQSDEDMDHDFEDTPRSREDTLLRSKHDHIPSSGELNPHDALRNRQGSMATVKLSRRARLAEKLKEVYDLEDIQEVWAGPFASCSIYSPC
jgi:sterol 3beta-glucosyltransferase